MKFELIHILFSVSVVQYKTNSMYVRSTPARFVQRRFEFYTRVRTLVHTHLFFIDFCYLQTLSPIFLSRKPQKIQMFFSLNHGPLKSMNQLAAICKQYLLDTSKIECLQIVGAAVSRKKIVRTITVYSRQICCFVSIHGNFVISILNIQN